MRRYESYKDSGVEWLGKVPSHWEILSIRRLSQVKRGASPRPIDNPKYFDDDGEYAWVRISDVTASNMYLLETTQKLSNLGKSYSVPLMPGSLFLSIAGSVGKPIITKIKVCIHDGFVYFPEYKQNTKFLYYIFYSEQPYIGLGKMGTQLNLNTDTVGAIKIPIPPLSEQQKIAQFLDDKTAKIDQAVDLTEKQIALLKEHKQILIQNAVTQGLNPDVSLKDSGVEWIGQVPDHWEVSSLGKMLLPVSEKNKPNLPLLSITRELGVIERDVEDQESNHNFIPDDLSNYKVLKEGQFGMNKMKAWQGSYGVSRFTGIVSPAYYIFDFIKSVNPRFFHWAIRSKIYISFFGSASDGVRIGQWDLSKSRMKSIPFIIPSYTEQVQIADYLDQQAVKIDQAIALKTAHIEKLKEYKSVLINDVVTGKVRV